VIDNKARPDLYECHCNNCGDRFWIPPPDADEIECPTCKKMTPLIVLKTTCEEILTLGQHMIIRENEGRQCPSPS